MANHSTAATADPGPLVAICMATYNPPAELLLRQVRSIQAQTYGHWRCIICDDHSRPERLQAIHDAVAGDPRFVVHASDARVGFYYNFERCLKLVPAEAALVALADQDDAWHPDKLETLVGALRPGVLLVYSDMNIVDAQGRQLAATYWTSRPNNYTRLASLILANTVTGAASLFRRSLLDDVLPFPERVGQAFHDQWIAAAALALGEIAYVDRPLYDYVQHRHNVIGHFAPQPAAARQGLARRLFELLGDRERLGRVLRKRWTHWREIYIAAPRRALARRLAHGRDIYFSELMRVQGTAQELLRRGGDRLTDDRRVVLRRLARLDTDWSSQAWLAGRALRARGRTTETIGAEGNLLRALVWRHHDTRFAARPSAAGPPQDALSRAEVLRQKMAPLALDIAEGRPERVNLLVPTIDQKYLFGGYITKLNLARCLAEAGYRVRIVILDPGEFQPWVWKHQLRAYDGLARLFEIVEIASCSDRSRPLEVSPADAFIATTWWTAHVAHEACVALGRARFVYLIQEYEPFTFDMGSFAALAAQTYTFAHQALFSTELLRDYFRMQGLGVFREGPQAGDHDSVSFQNTITAVGPVQASALGGQRPRRLLLYARPEPHASRNMFELAVLALASAIREGAFQGDWEFHGIGTVGDWSPIALPQGRSLRLLPRQDPQAYRDVLRSHDLGLALMYTPHPSLVPIEMAAAGMLVVTNAFANKTAAQLSAISSNILAGEPTVQSIAAALKEAAEGAGDLERRARGSHVRWATRWDEAFNPEVMAAVARFLATGEGQAGGQAL